MTMGKKILLLAAVVFAIASTQAQDLHLTQYNALAVYQNAANTGMIDGNYRAGIQARNQWRAFTLKPYLTVGAAYDMKLGDRWGVGGYFLENEASYGYYEQHLVASGSYRITSPSQTIQNLSVGLQLGAINRSLRNDLIYDSQYSGETFDENIPSGEVELNRSKIMPESNLGVAYFMRDESKTVNPFAGISVYHLTAPNESFISVKSNLPRRFLFYGGTDITVNEKVMLSPKGMFQMQAKHQEINVGMSGYYDFQENNVKLYFEGGYRFNDAVLAGIGLQYNEFLYRFTYDITVSGLKSVNRGRGALEFSVVFTRGSNKSALKANTRI